MAKINLLPWRAERRAQRQKEFYGMLGLAAAIAVGLSLLVWYYYSGQISGQQARNDFLTAETAKLDQQIKEIEELDKQKGRLLARKKVIEELQANRSQMVHLFDSLVRTIPDGVVLTSIKQDGDKLTLEGRSQSNARVSTYMRNLEGSGWMTKPDLSIIEAKNDDKAPVARPARSLPYQFKLTVQLSTPNADTPATAPESTGTSSGAGAAAPSAPPSTTPPAAAPAPATQGSPAS
ncbi:MAG: PilN domain-containing protein [Pseudoxanthomonas sp.]